MSIKEKIQEAAMEDFQQQHSYDKAFDRKQGFIAGANYMLPILQESVRHLEYARQFIPEEYWEKTSEIAKFIKINRV